MFDLFLKGGPLMFPILLGSVIALAVFLERTWVLRRARVVPAELGERVRELVANDHLPEALGVTASHPSAVARILHVALLNAGRSREVVKERVEEVGRRESAHLERYVGVLGVISALEPLLGLLGTVTGMIGVFQQVVQEGVGDPRVLAEGIWEALITTAAGLTVAIVVYVGWRWLLARVRDLTLEMEEDAVRLTDLVAETAAVPAAPAGEAR